MDATKPPLNRGKFIVAFILLVASGIAAASIWLAHQQMRCVIPAMTTRVTQLIVNAPTVELLKLALNSDAAANSSESITIEGHNYSILEHRPIDPASDISRIRRWLVRDDNYDWPLPANDSQPVAWQYVLNFTDFLDQSSLAIDAEAHHVFVLPSGPTLSSRPMSENLRHFLESFCAK